MKRTTPFICCIALFLFAGLGLAQVNEVGPSSSHAAQTVTKPRVGGELFFQDLETPTGDIRLLGIGFDGNSFWATGANDMITARLYEFDSSWNLINTFITLHTSWGWRDLAFDGSYLYASDSYMIDQIDRNTGLGVPTIPSPISPARAMAYDPATDTFWTASWNSDIYNVDRYGSYTSYGNTLGGVYGMGWDTRNAAAPKLWIWSQDGSQNCQATEFDPLTGTFTGQTFDGNGSYGIAGGCDVYIDSTYGWMLLGMHQGTPDGAAGYSLEKESLAVDNDTIYTHTGGILNFSLDAGPAFSLRSYALLGSNSGTDPGIRLPSGQVLPLNRDLVTDIMWRNPNHPYFTNIQGDFDINGQATATINMPSVPSVIPPNSVLSFAFFCSRDGYEFTSNPVNVDVLPPPSDYRYDDGDTDNLLGWYSGGDMCWMHRFDEVAGCSTITNVQTIWGSALYPGYNPPDGTAAKLFVWEDPTDDGDPSDIVLLTTEDVVTQNTDTDIMNVYPLSTPATISGEFYVGAVLTHSAGQYVVPMDMDTPYVSGDAFYCGTNTQGGFDPANIMANQYTPAEYGYYWCVRGGF